MCFEIYIFLNGEVIMNNIMELPAELFKQAASIIDSLLPGK